MSSELQNMIDLLKSQLGYGEQGGGYTKYGDWYGKTVEFDSDYSAQPWCDMLLSWTAHKLGYEKWFGQFAFTPNHARWFVDHDAWGHDPEPGAVVFYDWSGSGTVDGIDHVGMVISADDDGTIHTIEGNVDGGYVREKTRDQTYVVGYGYPDKIKTAMQGQGAHTEKTSLTDAKSLTLIAAETPLTLTGVPSGQTAHQPGPGAAGALLLVALLLVVACLRVTRLSTRLAHVMTGPHRRDAASPERARHAVSRRTP
ncbi:CHAP domain-containing protein [Sphaerisporangium album]|uniref:CHAP domain-containing protein n=1 Tax=Sphaerisporangium album TaxID=509200 RepID=A0A367FPZ5_9ACTN|nr:CHAP domain-containing protein [Sphaerisporangium album]RCG32458.1 CHAP domain-containing protein [Sphaerisporangium album]